LRRIIFATALAAGGLTGMWMTLATPPLQAAAKPNFAVVEIPRVQRAPLLEEFLSMAPSPAWAGKLAKEDHFIERIPKDGTPVSQRTEAYLGYDEKNLYVIFICFDTQVKRLRARLSRRDDIADDDSVEIMLDTFHDHRRAYTFLSNAYGVQADGTWTEDRGFDFSFDTVWDSKAKITSTGYVVWMAIPFRSLRFTSADPQTWGIILNRGIPRNNEDTFWPEYTSRIAGRLNQEADATGLRGISPSRNLQFIPYGTFASFRELDLRDLNRPAYTQRDAYGQMGLDAKAVLKDKFVLDLTANPDFSQVESDDPQITVSQRFEVFFPEKRPFFLENASYFQTPFNLVFTRRIANPKFGARLTGKDGPWAVGLLVADDASPGLQVPQTDPLAGKHAYFAIARVNRDVGQQSTIGAIYTDREFDGSFNRIGGIDANIRLNSHWNVVGQALASSTLNTDGTYLAGPAFDLEAHRAGRQFTQDLTYNGRANGFLTEPGFDPQPGIQNVNQHTQYTFRPEGKKLISWAPFADSYWTIDNQGTLINWGYIPNIQAEFTRQTTLLYAYAEEGETLRPQDFAVLARNETFERHTEQVVLNSNYFRQVGVSIDYRWGTRVNYAAPNGQAPYLARRTSATATLTLRPTHSLRIDNSYLWFRFRDLATNAAVFNNHIIRSKWNYQITRALSLRFIGQYNAVLANPDFTNLTTSKSFNADFLLTYLVHPGTAFYVGYNSNLENLLSPLGVDGNGNLLRTPNHFINDGRHLFLKASYLFRF
jgi:Domain of unknown function (DUF5916)/Carbohydrate family 9 binding domain-like